MVVLGLSLFQPYAVWLSYSLTTTKRALATAQWPFVWDLSVVGRALPVHLKYDPGRPAGGTLRVGRCETPSPTAIATGSIWT